MRHRPTAWMALFAMLTSMALPAHAYRMQAVEGLPGADFCTTVQPADAAADSIAISTTERPAPPEHDHGLMCDSSCGCSGVAAASALPRSWPTLAAASAVPADLPATRQPAVTGFALARGPPAQS